MCYGMAPFSDRLKQLERRLTDNGASGAIIGTGPNARYFTGFSGERNRHLLFLVTADSERSFFSPKQYAGQVRKNSRVGEVRSVSCNTIDAVVSTLVERLPDRNGQYFVDGGMPAEEAYRLERALPDATFTLLDEIVMSMRSIKDKTERDALRNAAAKTDQVSRTIRELGDDVIGLTERELAVEIRSQLHEQGAERMAFPVVVAAGPNGAHPTQHRHGDRQIEKDEPVVLDFGGFFDGYASDQTRTVVFDGDPLDKFVEAHRIVRAALKAGVEAAQPGMTASELDSIVRDVVVDHGYGDEFITGTGHGVGLQAHEPPSISAGSDAVLESGMVFSIEPGIYVEGEFGVRLETLMILTEDGSEMINDSPYTWRPL